MDNAIDVEAVVIGGGVAGLWVLNDLRERGQSAILLERRELGGCQTCHSHVYIHQGHIYRQIPLAVRLRKVTQRWYAWFDRHPSAVLSEVSWFGFRNEDEFEQKCALWDEPSLLLSHQPVPAGEWPEALRGDDPQRSAVRIVAASPERCLDGSILIDQLRAPVADRIFSVDDMLRFRKNRAGTVVEEIEVRSGRDGVPIHFRPRAVVLAAGAGNLGLLAAAGAAGPVTAPRPQQIRKAHMLVIRGKKEALPSLTGVFASIGALFLVSRDQGEDNVWLVSDNRSEPVSTVEDWMLYDARWWLPPVLSSLRELAPAVFAEPGKFQWGVYEAPKAEGSAGGAIPEEDRVVQSGFQNLWTVWPTKLTLAPRASETVICEMSRLFDREPAVSAALPASLSSCGRPPVAPELWAITPLMDWGRFSTAYRV